jgi:hypothetical protein
LLKRGDEGSRQNWSKLSLIVMGEGVLTDNSSFEESTVITHKMKIVKSVYNSRKVPVSTHKMRIELEILKE